MLHYSFLFQKMGDNSGKDKPVVRAPNRSCPRNAQIKVGVSETGTAQSNKGISEIAAAITTTEIQAH